MMGCGDNDMALTEYYAMLGITPEMYGTDGFYCERDAKDMECEDALTAAICRDTCDWSDGKMRRLSTDRSALNEMSKTVNVSEVLFGGAPRPFPDRS